MKTVYGERNARRLRRTWFFASDSNRNKLYQTLEYDDGFTSCECPGWTRRNPPGGRTCKHVRLVQCGFALANHEAMNVVSHIQDDAASLYDPIREAIAPKPKPACASHAEFAQLGRRKFAA